MEGHTDGQGRLLRTPEGKPGVQNKKVLNFSSLQKKVHNIMALLRKISNILILIPE